MLILRNASPLALLSAAAVMCIGYAAPAGAVEKGKIVEVPASTARAMTPSVGVGGSLIGIHWSLALSALLLLAITLPLQLWMRSAVFENR
jgi:hypothetical protein